MPFHLYKMTPLGNLASSHMLLVAILLVVLDLCFAFPQAVPPVLGDTGFCVFIALSLPIGILPFAILIEFTGGGGGNVLLVVGASVVVGLFLALNSYLWAWIISRMIEPRRMTDREVDDKPESNGGV